MVRVEIIRAADADEINDTMRWNSKGIYYKNNLQYTQRRRHGYFINRYENHTF